MKAPQDVDSLEIKGIFHAKVKIKNLIKQGNGNCKSICIQLIVSP